MKILRIFSYILIAIIVVLGISFAIANDKAVELHYYFGTVNVALSLLLVYSLGIGIILGFLAMTYPCLKAKRQNKSLQNRVKQLESELATRTINQNHPADKNNLVGF